jgi:hypothetical protein
MKKRKKRKEVQNKIRTNRSGMELAISLKLFNYKNISSDLNV